MVTDYNDRLISRPTATKPTFEQELNGLATSGRANGATEFRIAAMRMFQAVGMNDAARMIGRMHVDAYLTAEEIATRNALYDIKGLNP